MSTRPRYTSRDLETLPNLEGLRYEIIDGELFVSKQPSIEHQYVCGELGAAFSAWNRQATLGFAFGAPGVIFAADDDVAPDLVWISRERLSRLRDEAGHFQGAPELMVEVLSPGSSNERRDRQAKLGLYSRQAVLEYWIVDWWVRHVQVYRRQDSALTLVATLLDDDALTSPLLPEFRCPIASLWPPF